MTGKGSKRRPTQVSGQQFDNNWDNIFGKKDDNMSIELTRFFSDNGKKEITISKVKEGFVVEVFERSRLVSTPKVFASETQAENYAEDLLYLL